MISPLWLSFFLSFVILYRLHSSGFLKMHLWLRRRNCRLKSKTKKTIGSTGRYYLHWNMYSIDCLFIYLIIYQLRQEAWITHRASSTTSSRKKKIKKKKKITNKTNKNDTTLETILKGMGMQKQNWRGHR